MQEGRTDFCLSNVGKNAINDFSDQSMTGVSVLLSEHSDLERQDSTSLVDGSAPFGG